MFELVPYKEAHVLKLIEQPINFEAREFHLSGHGKFLETQGHSFTFMKDGAPLGCGGIIPIWEGRGQIWTVFSDESKRDFVPVFRAIRKHLRSQLSLFPRIEVCVPYHFEQGKRRARMLGFELEIERARKYLPDGSDCAVFVMVGE